MCSTCYPPGNLSSTVAAPKEEGVGSRESWYSTAVLNLESARDVSYLFWKTQLPVLLTYLYVECGWYVFQS